MLEKKNENQEMLKNGRVNSKIRRVDIDNQLKMSHQKDMLKGIKIEKVKLQLEDVKEEGLVVYKAFIRRLVRNMIVVIRSLDIEQQCLKILNRREASRKQDKKLIYIRQIVSILEQYIKV